MASGQVRVAVVGIGEVGRGWATLCVAAGWPVALFDNQAEALDVAPAEISGRARALVSLGQADEATAETGIAGIKVGRSLLQACGDAQWIIEAIGEDLASKQKLFEAFESVAPKARAITSSSDRLSRSSALIDSAGMRPCLLGGTFSRRFAPPALHPSAN